jgi:hypothetical protein
MNTTKAILSCAVLLALAACAHSRSIFDQDTPDTDTLTERTRVDLAQLTPEQRDSLVAKQARDSAQLQAIGFLKRESTFTDAYFIEPDEIAAIQPKVIADIFRHVPVLIERPGPSATRLRGAQACFLTYVNGSMLRARLPNELDTFVRARDVLAAEVYPPGGSPPAPFATPSTRSECTTVALWTRSRPTE